MSAQVQALSRQSELETIDEAQPAGRAVIMLLAAGAGVGVASVYYSQPILPLIRQSLGATSEQMIWVPAVAQAGYAVGMLLLAPLGDFVERKRLVLVKSTLLVITLTIAAVSPALSVLLIASLALGILGSLGQDFVPMAAHLATEERRGHTIGVVTTGLLCGILLSRTVSGVIGSAFGWRAIYEIAAVAVALVALAVWRWLPYQPATVSGSYASLLKSLVVLFRKHAVLRKSLLTQAFLAAPLGAFWSVLALMLAGAPFHLGPAAAGEFGLAGAAGALGAPLFGRLADSRGPSAAIRIGATLVIVAFLLLLVFPQSLPVLIVSTVLFDLGVMAGLVSHQSIVTSIDPAARSRLNGLLMSAAMIGMSVGATVGGFAWNLFGWTGICALCALSGCLALLRSILPPSSSLAKRKA
ncbi:MFS transporter [Rhizobium multihospitium]|uniref:Predicted arabinose efflux permease, MFS family n=1 Tax=Rhizobium multihospitium TaxID=410764 RepID=A0A1C3X5A0_9HYPH|nr:MFS transporter [Rhizobium multihospitium]SCB47433.1 Predicted arabinose efflux permease, MFS family [Rhizobium multihospitium]